MDLLRGINKEELLDNISTPLFIVHFGSEQVLTNAFASKLLRVRKKTSLSSIYKILSAETLKACMDSASSVVVHIVHDKSDWFGELSVQKIGKDRYLFAIKEQTVGISDPLTGLLTREAYNSVFRRKVQEYQRGQEKSKAYNLGMIVIDANGLKEINDTKGHEAGDAYLCDIANVLERSVRAEDILFRLGGDEFVIIPTPFKHSTKKGNNCRMITLIKERITEEVKQHNKLHKNRPISLSVGGCCTCERIKAEKLFVIADQHMYASKRSHYQTAKAHSK